MTRNQTADSDHLALAYASFAIFAEDGSIDLGELNFLLGLALRDGTLDDMDKRILAGVFNRVLEQDVSAEVWKRVQAVRKQHGI